MSISQLKANTNDVVSGKRLSQKQVILQLLKDGLPMTRKHIKTLTRFQTETISGRLSDLAKEGLVLETPVGTETYYSPIYAKELTEEIKKRKSEEKTKRVLKALLNDDEAFRMIGNVFIQAKNDKEKDACIFLNKIFTMIKYYVK